MSKAKQTALILLVLAGALIAILAMSLPNMVLLPGQSFKLAEAQSDMLAMNNVVLDGELLYNIFRGLIAIVTVLLPVYVIYSIFTKEGRKRLIVNVLMIALLFLVADYLEKHPPDTSGEQQLQMTGLPQDQGLMGDSVVTAVFSPEPPSWLTLVIIAAGSLIVAAIGSAFVWYFRRQTPSAPTPLEQLAGEAQSAIVSIHAGGDVRETIIHAYREMSRVLKQERGLARDATMTPREFEYRLAGSGLPQESITGITRLFEQVRYGHTLASPQERDRALACLTDIVNACKVAADGHG